jgi:hypothetical protein
LRVDSRERGIAVSDSIDINSRGLESLVDEESTAVVALPVAELPDLA